MRQIERKLSSRLIAMLADASIVTQKVLIYGACPSCAMHLRRRGIQIAHELPLVRGYAASVPSRLLPILASKGYIKYIEPDLRVQLCMDRANDTVGAVPWHTSARGGKGVTIAAIDTGVFPHRDFLEPKNRIRAFVDLVGERDEAYDDNGHGTFCLSCAAGSGAASGGKYRGVADQADLIMVKAMDANGGGRISDILRAMQWVSDNKERYRIRILSMSLGIEPGILDPAFDALKMAAQLLWQQGIVVVAAAGNSGPKEGTINSPGSAEAIVTVGAADDRTEPSRIAPFSSRGSSLEHKPDLIAPGVNLTAADASAPDAYRTLSGTSFAAPIAAGCAALILERYPELAPDEVKQKLLDHAQDIGEPFWVQGAGLVKLEAADYA